MDPMQAILMRVFLSKRMPSCMLWELQTSSIYLNYTTRYSEHPSRTC